jgi:hypothetical protein
MRKVMLFLAVALFTLSFCSRDKAGAPGTDGGQPAATDARGRAAGPEYGPASEMSQDATKTAKASSLRIHSVSLRPEAPTVRDDVVARPEMANPVAGDIKFRYQWFVNGKEVLGIYGDTLESIYFKKGAWLYCRAQAVYGDGESEWCKSEVIRVLNSLPVLRLAPVAGFAIPGEFSYQAEASDADDDALTYELISPQEQGIVIDPKSGRLSWSLDADTVKRLGETVEIQLAVSDGEGEKVTGKITLTLTSTKKTY